MKAQYSFQIAGADDPLNRLQRISYDTLGRLTDTDQAEQIYPDLIKMIEQQKSTKSQLLGKVDNVIEKNALPPTSSASHPIQAR